MAVKWSSIVGSILFSGILIAVYSHWRSDEVVTDKHPFTHQESMNLSDYSEQFSLPVYSFIPDVIEPAIQQIDWLDEARLVEAVAD